MTTDNEDVQPQPGEGLTAEQQEQQQQQPVAPASTDPDEVELSAALEAAKAEETADGTQATNDNTGQANAQQPTAPAQPGQQPQSQQQQPQAEQVMIPKARLDEEAEKRRKADENAAYWRGVAEARVAGAPAQPGQQPQQPTAPTADQRIAELQSQIDAAAKKFDDGEIGYAEVKRIERETESKIAAIRQEAAPRTQTAPAPAPAAGNELYLETLTAELETKHPWVKVFDQVASDSDWDYLKGRAIENLAERGIDPRRGEIGKYELRKEIAQLADQLGPSLIGERAKAKGVQLPGQPPQQQQQQQQSPRPQLSPAAQARQAALQKANNAPPNLNSMTGGNDPSGVPTDASLETMTDEQIAALPQSVQNKILGITA